MPIPKGPKTHGYVGSEEFIRMQFDEYLLALLAATKYRQYLDTHKPGDQKFLLADIEGDPSSEFYPPFFDAWRETENYKLWNRITDSHLFDIVEPRHPCAGGLTIEDVQRRLASQVAELHLDERFNQTREVVGKRLNDGRNNVTSAFNKVWADIEVMREAQRNRSDEARAAAIAAGEDVGANPPGAGRLGRPDMQQAQASMAAAGQRASAYLSSWGAWASEKRKGGWRSSPAPEEEKSNRIMTIDEIAHEHMKNEGDSWVDVDSRPPTAAEPEVVAETMAKDAVPIPAETETKTKTETA